MYHTAIFYPDINLSMSAQTKEGSASLLEAKHKEIIKFYPLIANEIVKASFNKDKAEIIFTSGSTIDNLANQQSSKGQRRGRINIEESALLNNLLFKDVMEPIPCVPRRTIGKLGVVSPEEMNGMINFFTTSGYRGTDEYTRNIQMIKDMINLRGKIVLGADLQLAVHYGRGETKSQILAKKNDPTSSPTAFAQNYESRWVGASDGALISIDKLISLRTLVKPELKGDKKHEYILGMDVARSQSDSNNKSCIAVLKIIRSKNGLIRQIHLVNLIVPPNGTSFPQQVLLLKKTAKQYGNILGVAIDSQNVGQGIVDYSLQETIDHETNETYECWDTTNTDHQPDNSNANKIIYCITAAAMNTDILVNFMDQVENGRLKLIINNKEVMVSNESIDYISAFMNTDLLIEEVANLKLKETSGKKLMVEKVVRKIDKDRFSAVAYGLYLAKVLEEEWKHDLEMNTDDLYMFSAGF
jgi:ribonucleoside-diphosphate reductase alpha chain